ncbi:MAG: YCF48-related protein [Candidatus Eremiobacterota bacterium]
MSGMKWLFHLLLIYVILFFLITGCGGGSETFTAPVFTGTPGLSNTPTPTVTSNTPSPTVSSNTPSPTVVSGGKGELKGYVLAKSDGNVDSLVMIIADSAPNIAGYLPVKSASVSLSNNPFVVTTTDTSGHFILGDVPYSQTGNVTKVSVTGDTSNIQSSAFFVPLEIEVITNPPVDPVNITSVSIVPSKATVYTNEIRQFMVYCINSSNELIKPDSSNWSVEGEIGIIDNNGIFHASDNAGQGSVKVTAGSQSATVPVNVEKRATAGTITGVVSYLDGNPATGMKVTVSGLSQFATVDSTGGYKIDKIPPGEITVTVTDNGKSVWTGKSTVKLGEITTLDIHLDYSLWKVQNSGSKKSLQDVCFINSSEGWVVGVETILHSTNGGKNWNPQDIGSGYSSYLSGVYFVDSQNGWTVDGSRIFHTSNGGNNWAEQYYGSAPYGIYFLNVNEGWGVGSTILHTNNGGTTWNPQTSPDSHTNFWQVQFIDSQNGWAAGYNDYASPDEGKIIHTSDGGTTWNVQYTGSPQGFLGMHFVDSNNGWVAGIKMNEGGSAWEGIILHTSNGGSTWTTQVIPTKEYIWSIYFVDSNNGWAVGGNGTILRTINGGITWTSQSSPIKEFLRSVYFTDLSHGWAVGDNGTILKY